MDRRPGIERAPEFAVRRARLEGLLDKIPPGGVGVVVAAAGSGKSLLVSQWAGSLTDTHVAPLVVTDRHNDPTVFGAELIDVLEAPEHPLDQVLGGYLASGAPRFHPGFLDQVLVELAKLPHDVLVVLDDFHNLEAAELIEDLDEVIDNLSDNVRMVIAARWDPPLTLRRLRTAGRLVEVRGADLAFDDTEAALMVESVSGREIDEEQVHLLVERTDGWAVGLQLASISLRSADDPGVFLHDFTGTDRLVVEYLTAEVLDRQDAATRRFLFATAVLPWLTAELCQEVTGRADARAVLGRLFDHSMFLVALDRSGTRFRYHHLFGELLVHQAALECGSAELARIRTVAAAWFRREGAVSEAVDQLLDAGAWSEAFDLVWDVGREYFQRGEAATLVRWLSRIDRADWDAPAAVTVNLLAAQLAACRFAAGIGTHRRIRRRDDLTPHERIAADALYSCCALDGLAAAEVIEVASGVLAELPQLDPTPTAGTDFLGVGGIDTIELFATGIEGLAHFSRGDLEQATAVLERASTLTGMEYPIWRINVLGGLGLVRAWSGYLDDAQRLGANALTVAESVGAEHHVALNHARLALALVCLHRSDLEQCAAHLGAPGHPMLPLRGAMDHDIRSYLLARLAWSSEGPDSALRRLDEPFQSAVPPDVLRHARQVLRAELQLAAGDPVAARVGLAPQRSCPQANPVLFDLELHDGDKAAARAVLERWLPDATNLLEGVQRAIRVAVMCRVDRNEAAASAALTEAVAMAEPEGLVGPFLDCAPALGMLEGMGGRRPRPFLRRLNEAGRGARSSSPGRVELIEPLTERELEVLGFLPTRLTNADIGQRTFMSVNTVKTHLRNIYRKLNVGGRDAAVERARELGLL